MNQAQVVEIIKAGISKVTGNENIQVTENMRLYDDFNFDSLDFVEFVFHTEKLLNVTIKIEDLILDESIKSLKTMTVGQYCNFLSKKLHSIA